VRLTTLHRKTLLLRNFNRGGPGPIWAVAPWYGWTLHLQSESASPGCREFDQ
jgi:hypothetical protein